VVDVYDSIFLFFGGRFSPCSVKALMIETVTYRHSREGRDCFNAPNGGIRERLFVDFEIVLNLLSAHKTS
jgi:hypothetical protein